MIRTLIFFTTFSGAAALAQEGPPEEPREQVAQSEPASESGDAGVKTMLGMSILGNEEAPKALVIVPWKSSQIGDGLGVTNSMDDRARPVDREVFMREIHYYELRSGTVEE
jgi:hypothetical protein